MLNDHNEPMQSIIYQGKRIQFKTKHSPGTPSHLRAVAENYFSTGKEVRDMVI